MIFNDLLSELNSPEFQTLRSSQDNVLQQYSALLHTNGRVKHSDVAIEMPAGTGKTLVALLISEYHRRLSRKVVILTGTKQLARQVSENAKYLGVDTTVFEGPGMNWSQRDLLKYRGAETIAIMNYWAYFNINPKPVPADILIFDDAHLAENVISELYTIHINKDNPLYLNIIKAISVLSQGRYTLIEDTLKGIFNPDSLLLPFSDFCLLKDQIVQYLDDLCKAGDTQVRFVWPGIRDKLDAIALYVTGEEIELRPIIYPIRTFKHFNQPIQRIYLSATLGDPGDFQRRIGCGTLRVIRPSEPQLGERGRRMIVLFPSKDEDNYEEIISKGLHIVWPIARKRLWMCSSWHEVEKWKLKVPPLKDGSTSHIFELKGSDEVQLEGFRQASLGHLFTAGRYDGMDFPGDQCRLAIIPNSPIISDPQEEFFSAHLRDAIFLKSRFSQRVAQALGRCNREPADFAVYIFLDPRFERRFGGNDPDYLSYLPSDIQAEMEAALSISEDGFEACCSKAKDFLSGIFKHWDSLVDSLRKKTKTVPHSSRSYSTANSEVEGWLALWNGDPVKAIKHFQDCEAGYKQEHISGSLAFSRYCIAWAHYICHLRQISSEVSLEDSIKFLESSASVGPSYWFTTILRAVANDLRDHLTKKSLPLAKRNTYKDAVIEGWEKILYERGLKESSLKRWLDGIENDIISNFHDQTAGGVEKLGELIGFESFRPKGSGMPDVVWRFSRDPKFIFTWEIKAELKSDRKICLADINQAHGHGRWAQKTFSGSGYKSTPLILSCSGELEPGIESRLDNVRCITQSTLHHLTKSIRAIFESFKILWRINDSAKCVKARQHIDPMIPSSEWLFEICQNSKTAFISKDTLSAKWQKI